MLVLIAFGLWIATTVEEPRFLIDATYAEDVGEQLLEDSLDLAPESELEFDEQIITPDDLPEVEDPLATPAVADIAPNPNALASVFVPTTIGLALQGRTEGRKHALLNAYGGNASTEAAVVLGLKWLKRQQRRTGLWSLRGPYSDGSSAENLDAATAMALLAFQGAGNTHQAGLFRVEVAKAWKAMLGRIDEDGNFFQGDSNSHRFYTQAQCTIALCELYGMTGDKSLREPAQRAIDFLVRTQQREGGWQYYLDRGSDMSVTGWVLMALQSARMAGLEVPSPTLERIKDFLDLVAKEGGSLYAYRPRDGAKLSMTAEGLLCRQYLGWSHDDPRLLAGADELVANLPTWERGQRNVYYWYYATQVCHHMEGRWWEEWNGVMRQMIPENQVQRGRERGSWDSEGDRWGPHGGRLYVTCLSLYMLEVYYRHLPLYTVIAE